MHSAIITIVAIVLAIGGMVGIDSPPGVTLSLLGLAVAFVGVPHGAADHLEGKRLLAPILDHYWTAVFFTAYLIVGAAVAAGWLLLPTPTIFLFFLIAAWHFGLEERDQVERGPIAHLRAIASGGLVIWVPCWAQGSEVASLLQMTSLGFTSESAESFVSMIAATAIVLGPVALADCLGDFRDRRSLAAVQPKSLSRIAAILLESRAARCGAFVMLFTIVDPLASFAVYFCGWHSVRGLADLHRKYRLSALKMARMLAPLTLMALLIVLIGAAIWSVGQSVTPATVRTLFVGLGALAVPHLMLHVLAHFGTSKRQRHPSTLAGAIS